MTLSNPQRFGHAVWIMALGSFSLTDRQGVSVNILAAMRPDAQQSVVTGELYPCYRPRGGGSATRFGVYNLNQGTALTTISTTGVLKLGVDADVDVGICGGAFSADLAVWVVYAGGSYTVFNAP